MTTSPKIYTISELNQIVRDILEGTFPGIWVAGEISNLRIPSSGHVYFSLKDSKAQIRCALFKNRLSYKNNLFKEGMQVLIYAQVSLYEERGDFQLIVEHIEEMGEGALRRAFEALKQRLTEEGLFDLAHKKTIPTWPRCVGVITSSTGAALRDILHVLKRRFPALPVIIYPTQVQGNLAADQIVKALHVANQNKLCDVLILARGGGSLEDLWPFNEERVARAIFDSEIPVVTGVGHETDTTIADWVADQRAPTPSAAAELVSPDQLQWLEVFSRFEKRLEHVIRQLLKQAALEVIQLEKRLPHPKRRLQDQAQRLDTLFFRFTAAYEQLKLKRVNALQILMAELYRHTPQHQIKTTFKTCQYLEQQLKTYMQYQLMQMQNRVASLAQSLGNVSPLNTLERGYAIVSWGGRILKDAAQVQVGDKLEVRLAKGGLVAEVLFKRE